MKNGSRGDSPCSGHGFFPLALNSGTVPDSRDSLEQEQEIRARVRDFLGEEG